MKELHRLLDQALSRDPRTALIAVHTLEADLKWVIERAVVIARNERLELGSHRSLGWEGAGKVSAAVRRGRTAACRPQPPTRCRRTSSWLAPSSTRSGVGDPVSLYDRSRAVPWANPREHGTTTTRRLVTHRDFPAADSARLSGRQPKLSTLKSERVEAASAPVRMVGT